MSTLLATVATPYVRNAVRPLQELKTETGTPAA
jgi:hypothetical protein